MQRANSNNQQVTMIEETLQDNMRKYRFSSESHQFIFADNLFQQLSEIELDDLSTTNSESEDDDSIQNSHNVMDQKEQIKVECEAKMEVSVETNDSDCTTPLHTKEERLPPSSEDADGQ